MLTRVAVAWLGSQNGLCAVFIRASRSDHLLASSCIVPMLMLLDQTARLDQGTDGVLPSTPTQVCLYTAHINQSRTNNWRLHCITFHVLARQSTANSSQIHQTLIGQADPNRGPASSHVKQRNCSGVLQILSTFNCSTSKQTRQTEIRTLPFPY